MRRPSSPHAASLPPFPGPPDRPLTGGVTVVVNNHDYGGYVSAAVDSALAQEGVTVQVVVVDDGSTDDSRAVLASYGDRIDLVLQENLGQRAAFNAGLDRATGDLVIFLDADDLLAPAAAAAALDALRAETGAARVVFRLAVVDADGRPGTGTTPPPSVPLPCGDVRPALLAFPDDLGWPPTSGNAFARWALERVMPLPVDGDRTGADQDLHPLLGLLGPVVAIDRVLGSYRVHDRNAHARLGVDLERSADIVRWSERGHRRTAELAQELGCPPPRPRSVTVAVHRLLLARLDGARGGRGRAIGAALDGARAAAGRFDRGLGWRAACVGWFAVAAVAPPWCVRRLADRVLHSGTGA